MVRKVVSRSSVLAALFVGFATGAGQQAIHATSQAYGPRFTIHISRPTLMWQVWSQESKVTEVEMLIDSESVHARYDADHHTLIYTPESALTVGAHHVLCKATFDGSATFTKEWDTTIATDAVPKLPGATELQGKLLKLANAKRHELGLGDMVFDDRLNAAAMAHSNYMATNKLDGHNEIPGSPCFIGQTGGQRCESFGWCTGSWEGISAGEQSLADAVRDLYDAPYHRIPFMQPGQPFFGAGTLNSKTTLVFGMGSEKGIEISPADGQTGIPVYWINHEVPSPLRQHMERGSSGYPLVVAGFGPALEKIKVSSASLKTSDGKTVDIWLQTPENDEYLKNGAIIIPQKPLEPKTTYVATAEVSYGGTAVSKTWTFTTE